MMNKKKLNKINKTVHRYDRLEGIIEKGKLVKLETAPYYEPYKDERNFIMQKYAKRANEDTAELLNKKLAEVKSELKELGYEDEEPKTD